MASVAESAAESLDVASSPSQQADTVSRPVPCLYCGSAEYTLLHKGIRDRLRYVDGEWAYYRCNRCGSSTISPTPKQDEIASLYPPVYTFSPELAKAGTLKRLLAKLESVLFYDSVYRAQVSIVDRNTRAPGAKPGRLLDIGCGRGRRLLHFRDRGYDVCGLDFQPEAVEYLNETLQIPCVQSDLAGMTAFYEPNSFDLITAFHVLEHVLDVRESLEKCLTILKPGGWLAVAIPIADSTQALALGKRWTGYTEAPRHISLPARDALVELCKEVGFDHSATFARPESLLACAGTVALSLLPSGATTTTFSRGGFAATMSRVLGFGGLLAALPWALWDHYAYGPAGRTGFAIIFARKPA